MTTTHSPGPWRVTGSQELEIHFGLYVHVMRPLMIESVARDSGPGQGVALVPDGWANNEANAERIAACVNAFEGASLKAIKGAGFLCANLELMLMDWDRWNESYVEDMFPRWLLDLAGGLENLDVIRKEDDEEGDDA